MISWTPSTPGCGWHSRGYLPHFDRPGLIQRIAFRLADSVPGERIVAWKKEMQWMDRNLERAKSEADEALSRELHRRISRYEDSGTGECHLRQPAIVSVVVTDLTCFDGERYELQGFCVVPIMFTSCY